MLGDLVGYGADPNAVIERIQGLAPTAIVRGNHDKVACGLDQAEGFNTVAKSAANWTLDVLTPAHREWLAALPEGPIDVDELVEICHGSPFDEDAYIFDELDAVRALKVANRPLCLFGHTHYPVDVRTVGRRVRSVGAPTVAEAVPADARHGRYLVNPGSVGQPRDGDPRAAYAIVDDGTAARRAVTGSTTRSARRRRRSSKAGLPDVLAQRLAVGR